MSTNTNIERRPWELIQYYNEDRKSGYKTKIEHKYQSQKICTKIYLHTIFILYSYYPQKFLNIIGLIYISISFILVLGQFLQIIEFFLVPLQYQNFLVSCYLRSSFVLYLKFIFSFYIRISCLLSHKILIFILSSFYIHYTRVFATKPSDVFAGGALNVIPGTGHRE